MSDRERIETLVNRLDHLRSGRIATWQRAIREVAIRALEEEVERLWRRVGRHRRAGLVA